LLGGDVTEDDERLWLVLRDCVGDILDCFPFRGFAISRARRRQYGWQRLIADDICGLAYAPSLGHPAQLSRRKEAVRHATWFVGAVENFQFFDLNVYALADVQGAVAEVKGEGLIKSTGRMYHQDYVVFLRAVDGNS
jgi:hypothetical protein